MSFLNTQTTANAIVDTVCIASASALSSLICEGSIMTGAVGGITFKVSHLLISSVSSSIFDDKTPEKRVCKIAINVFGALMTSKGVMSLCGYSVSWLSFGLMAVLAAPFLLLAVIGIRQFAIPVIDRMTHPGY